MRPANHVVAINVLINIAIESNNSHSGTPNGNLPIIITGEVKGIMLIQNANIPSGLSIIGCISMKDNISGIVTGNINC